MSRRALGCIIELLETVILAVLVFLGIQAFVAQPFRVQQDSMEPTVLPDQYALVDIFGAVPLGSITGRAWLRYWPPGALALLGGGPSRAGAATPSPAPSALTTGISP